MLEREKESLLVVLRQDPRLTHDALDRLTIQLGDVQVVATGNTSDAFKEYEKLLPIRRELLLKLLPKLQGTGLSHMQCLNIFSETLNHRWDQRNGLGWLQQAHIQKHDEFLERTLHEMPS